MTEELTFKRVKDNAYCESSECGQYTVPAIGGANGYRFEAWHLKDQFAVNLETAEEAREACRQHKAKRQPAVPHQPAVPQAA